MTTPNLSIVIPVFNEENNVINCLESIYCQAIPKSWNLVEVLIVDDGSTDKTLVKVKDFFATNKSKTFEYKIVENRKNMGRAYSRYVGAKSAKSDRLLFIDSRCKFKGKSNLVEVANNKDVTTIIGNAIIELENDISRFGSLFRRTLYKESYGASFESVWIDKDNFDVISKGTTILVCQKDDFIVACTKFDIKDKSMSDDILILKEILNIQHKIYKYSKIRVIYKIREDFIKEMVHTFNRGPKFVDYYLDIKKIRFWEFIFLPLFYLFSISILHFTSFLNSTMFLLSIVIPIVMLSVIISKNRHDFILCIKYLPPYLLVFELGIIYGLTAKIFFRRKSI